MRATKRWTLWSVAAALLILPAMSPAADSCAVLMIRPREVQATKYEGSQAGIDAAKAACGTNCYIQLVTCPESFSVGSIGTGMTIVRIDSTGWINYSKIVTDDSLRVNKGLTVGGQKVTKILRGSAVIDFDLSVSTSQDSTITVTGAVAGDETFLGVPAVAAVANTVFFAWVSAANTVTVRAIRTCDSTPDPSSGTFKVTVLQ